MASASKKRKSPKTPTTSSNNKKKATTPPPTTTTTQPWYTSFTKGDPLYDAYMSTEWGFSQEEGGDDVDADAVDAVHFESLSLEGAQSGLSWLTILRKREAYRRTFHNFDPVRVARMTAQDVQDILLQEGPPTTIVVRHRGKIESVVNNANCVLQIKEENGAAAAAAAGVGSFTKYLWSFVDHQPILNCSIHRTALSKSPESETMSKDLKKRGFRFVGPTTCYAMMQAMGLVIDHPVDTPEWRAAKERLQARKGGYQERT